MSGTLKLKAREQRLMFEICEALLSPLDLQEVLVEAYPLLCKLVSIDHGALCLSRPEVPGGYEWATAHVPSRFFAEYPVMAPHDFVREAVSAQPNIVLRDTEMITRPGLEANVMYHHSREIGMPLEQVMSVLLAVSPEWHGGITLYRASRRPFSDRDRQILQRLASPLARTMDRCRRYGAVAWEGAMLDETRSQQGLETISFAPPAREVHRTAGAETLLKRWFSSRERAPGGVPVDLLDQIARAARAWHPGATPPKPSVTRGSSLDLHVSFCPFTYDRRQHWMLLLKEAPHVDSLPPGWSARLTPTQNDVVSKLRLGWGNRAIARDLRCTEGTIKKHLQSIYDRLGVPNRKVLISLLAKWPPPDGNTPG